MGWVLSQISLVGYYHMFCATVPSNIQYTIVDKGFVPGMGFMLLF